MEDSNFQDGSDTVANRMAQNESPQGEAPPPSTNSRSRLSSSSLCDYNDLLLQSDYLTTEYTNSVLTTATDPQQQECKLFASRWFDCMEQVMEFLRVSLTDKGTPFLLRQPSIDYGSAARGGGWGESLAPLLVAKVCCSLYERCIFGVNIYKRGTLFYFTDIKLQHNHLVSKQPNLLKQAPAFESFSKAFSAGGPIAPISSVGPLSEGRDEAQFIGGIGGIGKSECDEEAEAEDSILLREEPGNHNEAEEVTITSKLRDIRNSFLAIAPHARISVADLVLNLLRQQISMNPYLERSDGGSAGGFSVRSAATVRSNALSDRKRKAIGTYRCSLCKREGHNARSCEVMMQKLGKSHRVNDDEDSPLFQNAAVHAPRFPEDSSRKMPDDYRARQADSSNRVDIYKN